MGARHDYRVFHSASQYYSCTCITETVRGEGPGDGASLDYALKEAMIQLDADILDFRKRLAQDKAVSGYDAVMEVILFPFFLFFLFLIFISNFVPLLLTLDLSGRGHRC